MIKVGDLVMVVKPTVCCGESSSIGLIFTFKNKPPLERMVRCIYCKNRRNSANDVFVDDRYSIEISRLIKIDPPALQDETTTEKELAI
jgi:hypothetical protein